MYSDMSGRLTRVDGRVVSRRGHALQHVEATSTVAVGWPCLAPCHPYSLDPAD